MVKHAEISNHSTVGEDKSYQFLGEDNFAYLCKGLTLDANDLIVLDAN